MVLPLVWVIIFGIVAGIGTIGNLLIIGAVCLSRRLRVRGNAFVVNLAIADLIVTSYIMPIGLVTSQYNESPFGKTLCDINAFLITTTCGISTQSLMLISLERYFHICKTKYYKKLFTPKLVGLYLVLIWIYTAAWTCQGWTGWTIYKYAIDVYVCLFFGPTSLSYDICLVLFGMLLPMVVTAFSYYKIFRTVRRSRKAMASHSRRVSHNSQNESSTLSHSQTEAHRSNLKEYRLIVTLFTIVVVFVIFWTPAAIVLTLSGIWVSMPGLPYFIGVWLAFCNSSVNSIIYGILNKNFRRGYANLVKFLCCCRREHNCDCHLPSSSQEESVSNSQTKALSNTATTTVPQTNKEQQQKESGCQSNQMRTQPLSVEGNSSTVHSTASLIGNAGRAASNSSILVTVEAKENGDAKVAPALIPTDLDDHSREETKF